MKVLALILLLGAVVARAEKDVETKVETKILDAQPDEAEVVVARADNDQEQIPAAETGGVVMASNDRDEIPELTASDVSIASSTSCSSRWTSGVGGRCYYLTRGSYSWTAARSYCQSVGGDLARADTSSRNDFITSYLTYGVDDVWIGLSDASHEGHFHWVGTDEHAVFENWEAGQPNGGDSQDCVRVNYSNSINGLWNDDSCGAPHRCLCERYASACNA